MQLKKFPHVWWFLRFNFSFSKSKNTVQTNSLSPSNPNYTTKVEKWFSLLVFINNLQRNGIDNAFGFESFFFKYYSNFGWNEKGRRGVEYEEEAECRGRQGGGDNTSFGTMYFMTAQALIYLYWIFHKQHTSSIDRCKGKKYMEKQQQ